MSAALACQVQIAMAPIGWHRGSFRPFRRLPWFVSHLQSCLAADTCPDWITSEGLLRCLSWFATPPGAAAFWQHAEKDHGATIASRIGEPHTRAKFGDEGGTSPPRKRMPRGVYLKTQFGLLTHEQLLECLYVKFARRYSLGGSQGGRAAGRVPNGHCRRHRTR